MKKLTANWLTEGVIDFEYKKYVLLAYLQWISQNFDEKKLYPFLADLIFQYQNLATLQTNKQKANQQFTKRIKKIDIDNFRLEYEQLMNDTEHIGVVENILNFAIPKIQEKLGNGKEIYESVEHHLEIQPIGILPLYSDEGYMLIANGKDTETKVFGYEITIFTKATEKYRAIRTNYIDSYVKSFMNTYENIKIDLIRRNKQLPNPATFLIHSPHNFPLYETFLPVAKRSLVRFIGKGFSQ